MRRAIDFTADPLAGDACSASNSARPPRVAHCVAGLVRSFAHPSLLLPKLLKRNVIDAVGGQPTLFLLLKTFDLAPKDALFRFPSSASEDLRAASPGQRTGLEAAISMLQPQRVELIASETFVLNPHCHYGTGSNLSATQSYSTEAGMRRHVGQMVSSRTCLEMIEQHEASAAAGAQFDLVVRTRPDVAAVAPLPPYCNFRDEAALYVAQAFNKDWLYVSSRRVANASLMVISLYEKCHGALPWNGHYEGALTHAVRRAGFIEKSLPMALALTSEPCITNSCSMMPGYKGHSAQLGCCAEGIWLQCHYQNKACDSTLRRPRSVSNDSQLVATSLADQEHVAAHHARVRRPAFNSRAAWCTPR